VSLIASNVKRRTFVKFVSLSDIVTYVQNVITSNSTTCSNSLVSKI